MTLLLIKEARICAWSSASKKPCPFQKGVEGIHRKHAEPAGATSRSAPLPGAEPRAPPPSPSLIPRKARREVLPEARPPSGLYKEQLQVDELETSVNENSLEITQSKAIYFNLKRANTHCFSQSFENKTKVFSLSTVPLRALKCFSSITL